MKKRIISIVLAIVLVCTMCLSASAASYSGLTTGGTEEPITIYAALTVVSNGATATTRSDVNDSSILTTTVDFTYINTSNRTVSWYNLGSSSANAFPNDIKDALSAICADSTHSTTSTKYGEWICYLHQDRW